MEKTLVSLDKKNSLSVEKMTDAKMQQNKEINQKIELLDIFQSHSIDLLVELQQNANL